ncbi:MAG: arsenate reductase (glutaredoxin) [Gammaproteobacteria bacterium]|nr:arsenate reductase (glutaredoxin) [Gammaproteobacteria bacterium]
MSEWTYYHNPRCSKSREALSLLESRGVQPRVVEYLKTPPSAVELRRILQLLGLAARELMRRDEDEYRELGLDAPGLSEDALIQAMLTHPRLIQRPILVGKNQARIGRPPERVLEILA